MTAKKLEEMPTFFAFLNQSVDLDIDSREQSTSGTGPQYFRDGPKTRTAVQ